MFPRRKRLFYAITLKRTLVQGNYYRRTRLVSTRSTCKARLVTHSTHLTTLSTRSTRLSTHNTRFCTRSAHSTRFSTRSARLSIRLSIHSTRLSTQYLPVHSYRSSRPEVFLVKGVLKICSKFTGKHPCRNVILVPYRSVLSIKLLSIKLLCNFIEITLRHGCSPVSLLHIFRTTFPWKTSG